MQIEKTVKEEEEEADKIAKNADKIMRKCHKELSKAKPMVVAAEDALNSFTDDDITIVKGLSKPAEGVKLVMKAVCILMVRYMHVHGLWNE
jgi:dynein heavy chain